MNENPCSNQEIHVLFVQENIWTWKYLKWVLSFLHDVIWKTLLTRLIISWMLLFAKTLHTAMTLWWRYVVRKFTADAISFREIQCKKKDILMFLQRFQCEFGWNRGKYARITIINFCFIALTLTWSLGRCLNTPPIGLVFKQLPRDPANVNVWKNMCDPYKNTCSNHEIHVLF